MRRARGLRIAAQTLWLLLPALALVSGAELLERAEAERAVDSARSLADMYVESASLRTRSLAAGLRRRASQLAVAPAFVEALRPSREGESAWEDRIGAALAALAASDPALESVRYAGIHDGQVRVVEWVGGTTRALPPEAEAVRSLWDSHVVRQVFRQQSGGASVAGIVAGPDAAPQLRAASRVANAEGVILGALLVERSLSEFVAALADGPGGGATLWWPAPTGWQPARPLPSITESDLAPLVAQVADDGGHAGVAEGAWLEVRRVRLSDHAEIRISCTTPITPTPLAELLDPRIALGGLAALVAVLGVGAWLRCRRARIACLALPFDPRELLVEVAETLERTGVGSVRVLCHRDVPHRVVADRSWLGPLAVCIARRAAELGDRSCLWLACDDDALWLECEAVLAPGAEVHRWRTTAAKRVAAAMGGRLEEAMRDGRAALRLRLPRVAA